MPARRVAGVDSLTKSQIKARSLNTAEKLESVVDAPVPSVVAAHQVSALAVGVVGDVIEEGHPDQVRVCGRALGGQREEVHAEVTVVLSVSAASVQESLLDCWGQL